MPRRKGQALDKTEVKEPLNLRVTPTGRKGLYGLVQLLAEKSLANLVDSIGWFFYVVLPKSTSEHFKSLVRSLNLDLPTALEKLRKGELTINLNVVEKPNLTSLIVAKLNQTGWDIEKFASECRLEVNKIDQVLAGKIADDETLVALAAILQQDIDKLLELNRGSNGVTKRTGVGNGAEH